MAPHGRAVVRRLSEMGGTFADAETVATLVGQGDDRIIYRSYTADVPEQPGHLAYLTTIILPGEVGGEYYVNHGHYHQKDSAEVYLGMGGRGLMLMQARGGQFRTEELTKEHHGVRSPGLGAPDGQHRPGRNWFFWPFISATPATITVRWRRRVLPSG